MTSSATLITKMQEEGTKRLAEVSLRSGEGEDNTTPFAETVSIFRVPWI